MNFITKPQQPESSSAIYIAARREWNERYGDYIAQARNWRAVAFAAIGGMCVCAAAVAWMGMHSRIEPYIVEVNKLGDALAVRRADIAPAIPQTLIRADIARWITDVRSVINDIMAERRMLREAAAMTDQSGTALPKLRDYLEANNPGTRGQTEEVGVTVQSVLPVSDRTWRVEWDEDTRHQDGAPNAVGHWNAIVTINLKPPVTDEQVLANPAGVFVESFSWGKHQ
jgi:type IV secretion system protein VirB5